MQVIFISGKYRGSSEYKVRMNIRKAEVAALFVWKHGGVAICPHKNTAGFGGACGETEDIWLKGDLELLNHSDAIWLIPGWQSSEGARQEAQHASKRGMIILSSKTEVLNYLRDGLAPTGLFS
jgi:hypothetical protein